MGLPTLASNPSQPPKDLEQPMKSISQVNILEAKPDVLETERRKASFLRQYTPVYNFLDIDLKSGQTRLAKLDSYLLLR